MYVNEWKIIFEPSNVTIQVEDATANKLELDRLTDDMSQYIVC